MRRYFGTLGVAAFFVLLACLPASAGPICKFCGVTLNGVANTSASGTFTFNNGQFSNISISFSGNSMFNGIQAIDAKAIAGHLDKKTGFWSFVWTTHVHGNSIFYSILFNPTTNQFWALGSIYKNRKDGGYFDNYFTVPEGGAILSYMFLSGAAVFAGIVMSGKQRHAARKAS